MDAVQEDPTTAPAPTSLWSELREALRGSHRDLTETPLGRAIFVLAVPMVLEMVMESVFAVTDIFFVGRLGAEAQATVGLTETMETMVYALSFGLSIGAMSLVARRMGEKDEEAAARTAVQAIALGLLFGIPLSAAGALLAPLLLRAMGASPWVLEHGVHFTRVMLGANVSVCLLFLINAIFRGAGDAATAMRVLWLANGINIVLGPCLIFGIGPFPRMGVVGAALATSIGRTTGVLYQLYRLTRGDGRLTVRMRHVRLEARTLLSVLRLSGAGTLQTVVGMTSWIFLVRIISRFGSEAVAGYTIAIRLILFALLPAFGLANAAATLVGQNLGARKPERAERAAWKAGGVGAVFLGSVGLIFIVAAPAIVGIFSHDPVVVGHAVRGLRIISAGFAFYAYGMTFTQSLNGAGATWAPTWLNGLCFWLFELPLAWVLAVHVRLGTTGAFVACLAAFTLLAVSSGLVFRRGAWKRVQV
ncbi:MAG TPA: MATE family efflux transporter [Myxococcaceae bacterium]|nr:MATE family efflux transporter [Myxococcaceae bacterium]